jgi:hypothetical protein
VSKSRNQEIQSELTQAACGDMQSRVQRNAVFFVITLLQPLLMLLLLPLLPMQALIYKCFYLSKLCNPELWFEFSRRVFQQSSAKQLPLLVFHTVQRCGQTHASHRDHFLHILFRLTQLPDEQQSHTNTLRNGQMRVVHVRLCTVALPIECRLYPDEQVFCKSATLRHSRQS